MVTFTINIPQMLAYIYHTWILWDSGPSSNRSPVLITQISALERSTANSAGADSRFRQVV